MSYLTRSERVTLAQRYFGLYLIGFATTPPEITDEDCCMDNMKVPFLVEQLNERQREILTEVDLVEKAKLELKRFENVTRLTAEDMISEIEKLRMLLSEARQEIISPAVNHDTGMLMIDLIENIDQVLKHVDH